jgi:hypothetical protein
MIERSIPECIDRWINIVEPEFCSLSAEEQTPSDAAPARKRLGVMRTL